MKQNFAPPYVVINNDDQPVKMRNVLRTKTRPISFPLSARNREIVNILEAKFDAEENCAGLAAPQIGFAKPIIVFAALEDARLKQWRPDFTQYMPKTIWVNPHYEPIDAEETEDYEGCFSVDDLAGRVKRFKRIKYTAHLLDGTLVTGSAEGFLARIIQHEVDHVRGVLFVDKVTDGKVFSISEYERLKREKMGNNK